MRATALRRAKLRRIRQDQMRSLRVLETVESSAVLQNSPIELEEGYVISDRESGELFVTLLFRSLSRLPVKQLDIRILLYQERSVVPDRKLEFTYSWQDASFGERSVNGVARSLRECRNEHTLVFGERFGSGIYIPLPPSYFKKMQVELLKVQYSNGRSETLQLIAGGRAKRFSELDEAMRDAYVRLNIFSEAEQVHPIRVLPQAGENAWLCCCGHKNPAALARCEQCGREKDWQLSHLSAEQLTSARSEEDEWAKDGKVAFEKSRARLLEDEEEIRKKVEECNAALQRIAAQERVREHRRTMFLPRLLLAGGAIALLYFLIRLLWFFLVT